MIELSNDGVFRSTLLHSYPGIIHGFTTKQCGNMKLILTRRLFMEHHGINPDLAVSQEQIHGTIIHKVTPNEFGTMVQKSDGLIYKHDANGIYPILLVRVGDCVPILFFDPKTHSIGVAHAGWKGTSGHIIKEMVRACISLGVNVKDMYVIMGPSICQKCYHVSDNVALLFHGKHNVDLIEANYQDCVESGIEKEHIDVNKQLCTYEHQELFYSWRRKDEPFGEVMGYIGLTTSYENKII